MTIRSAAGSIQNDLIFDEINTLVADAARSGSTLALTPHVSRFAAMYGTIGLSKERLLGEIVRVAAASKVPVLIGRLASVLR